MTRSEKIDELVTALCEAQRSFKPALKGSVNESFSSSYADLAEIVNATRESLTTNGLVVIQSPGTDKDGTYVDTFLAHKSGQWIESRLHVVLDVHGMGSAISYARRYALQSTLGVAAQDDDGNAATRPPKAPQEPKKEREAVKVIEGDWKGVTLVSEQQDKIGEVIWFWFDFSNKFAAFTSDPELAKTTKAIGELPCDVHFQLVKGKYKLLTIQPTQ